MYPPTSAALFPPDFVDEGDAWAPVVVLGSPVAAEPVAPDPLVAAAEPVGAALLA